jgi:hypothetical protein
LYFLNCCPFFLSVLAYYPSLIHYWLKRFLLYKSGVLCFVFRVQLVLCPKTGNPKQETGNWKLKTIRFTLAGTFCRLVRPGACFFGGDCHVDEEEFQVPARITGRH